VLYPLWDAGLAVGHAVRTPEDCLTLAAGRVDAATAMLDARRVAGDEELFERMRELVLGWVREDARGFAARLLEAARERRERYGSAAYLLEPELKEGGGGLRDIDSLGWLAAVVGESPDAPTLDGVGLLRTTERAAVDDAQEFLVRARSALHLEAGRRTDRLLLEQQPTIARDMGFADEPGLPAVDGLMRTLFAHARQVEHVVGSVFERFLGLDVASASALRTDSAEGILEAFAAASEEDRKLSPAALDRIEAADVPDPVVWTPRIREAFLRILRAGAPGVAALEALDRIDLLARYLPEWRAVRCRPQRDPYHRFTVDMHLLRALDGMGRLLENEGASIGEDAATDASDPVAREAAGIAGPRDGLLLGALLHDIGKTGEGSHVRVGGRVAAATLDRMGVEPDARNLARFMVDEHLLLPDTATRRDLADADLVLGVATRVESPERLAALYLLAVADAAATGPHAWTPWRRALVRELVGKVQRAFERGDMGREEAERVERATLAIHALLPDDGALVEEFLRRMPATYPLAVSPGQAVAHLRMLAAPVGVNEVRTAAAPGDKPATYALTVVAADRPGLLSLVAGALSLAGLSILSAKVFTNDDGVAVDLFELEGWFEGEIGEDRWREFRSSLRKALEGRLSLAHRVADKRRHYPSPRSATPIRVSVDDEASDFFTVIEVGAPDRIGLLFDVTRTLAELSLDVHMAKVATYGERVVDAFYVRDALGRKLDDPQLIASVRESLAERAAG
jgi:[protein-PII] uridylyltransferase